MLFEMLLNLIIIPQTEQEPQGSSPCPSSHVELSLHVQCSGVCHSDSHTKKV